MHVVSRLFIELIFFAFLSYNCVMNNATPLDYYLRIRENTINNEKSMFFGENLVLVGDEISANRCLMSVKLKEINEGYTNLSRYWPSRNFLDVRDNIEQSEVFKIIRLMPKGAVLHTHGTSTASLDFIFDDLANIPNLYVCFDNSTVRFRFFQTPNKDCTYWKNVEALRANDPEIINKLKKNISLPNAQSTGGYNTDVVWKKFGELFDIIVGLITYRPAFQKYLDRTLQELYDDNVMYLEFRGPFYKIYELNGTVHDPTEAIRTFNNTVAKFVKIHPDFLGVKFIFESNRQLNYTEFAKDIADYVNIKSAFPDFISGFDISNYEDAGHPDVYYAEKLLELSKNTRFYFHAGETNWFGHAADEDLFDAILLNSKRIGHGFALLKHPLLMKMVKEKNIAIEVNPISNQVLGYIADLRNHPAAYYFANNLSVVVSNDNPSFWGVSGLSYDYYEAFVGIMPRTSDLRALKQLAINSIEHSALTSSEKEKAFEIWEKSWFKFVKYLAREYNCEKN